MGFGRHICITLMVFDQRRPPTAFATGTSTPPAGLGDSSTSTDQYVRDGSAAEWRGDEGVASLHATLGRNITRGGDVPSLRRVPQQMEPSVFRRRRPPLGLNRSPCANARAGTAPERSVRIGVCPGLSRPMSPGVKNSPPRGDSNTTTTRHRAWRSHAQPPKDLTNDGS